MMPRHNSSLHFRALFFLTFLIVDAGMVLGQNTAARPDRGLVTSGVYSVSDIESVSLSNGNVGLSIPMAALPPIAGGKLSWTLNATYNSKLSDLVRVQQDSIDDLDWIPYTVSSPQLSDLAGWRIGGAYRIYIRNAEEDFDRLWYPGSSGLPYWELELLNNNAWYKVVLQTPDGAERELRPTGFASYTGTQDFLRGYFNVTPNPSTGTKYYSFDGTYIAATIKTALDWTIFMPDGTQVTQTPDGIQRIRDTNGNKIKIFWDANGEHYQDELTGREIRVTYDPAGNGGQGQSQVLYKTVGGATWQSVAINYRTTQVQGKPYQVTDWLPYGGETGGGTTCDRYDVAAYNITVVQDIVFPQTEPGQPARRFTFNYNSDTTHNATVSNFRWSCSDPYQNQNFTSSIGWGQLSQMVTPLGAVVKYSYSLDSDEQLPMIFPEEIARESITQKQIVHDSPAITDTWSYSIYDWYSNVTNPDGTSISESRYPHSPGFGYAVGKDGLAYASVQNGVLTHRHWTDKPFTGASLDSPGGTVNFNPVVDAEYTTINNAAGQPARMSAKTLQYDYNGNVTQVTEYDWFDPALVSRDAQGVPTGVPGGATVLRTTYNSYHNGATTAGSGNVYAVRPLTTGVPSIINAVKESTAGPAINRLSYDGQTYGYAPTVGNVTSKTVWDDLDSKWITTSSTYGLYGNLATATDARGKVTQFFYDDLTHALPNRVVVDPQNATGTQTTTTAYDYSTGLVTSVTDANGKVSTIDYTNQLLGTIDPFGRPGVTFAPAVTISGSPHRRSETMFYEDAVRRVRLESDLNAEGDRLLKTRTTSDQLGRTILTEQSENGSTYTITANTVYVQMGKIIFFSNPRRNDGAASEGWTRTTKDAAGRITEVATFGGAAQPPSTGTIGIWTGSVITAYDAEFTTVTEQTGKARRSMVDALGRLKRIDEPDSNNNLGATTSPAQPTSYSYDVFSNLKTVVQGTQTRFFMYDSLSRLRRARNPEQATNPLLALTDSQTGNSQWSIAYLYDDNGNLTQKTDARNVITTYGYDALNRATTRSYSDGTPAVTQAYDAASITNGKGRLASVSSSVSTYSYSGYDALGRVIGGTQTLGSQTYSLSYLYDLAGHVKAMTYPSGRTINYTFDSAGRLNSFSGNLGDAVTRTYATGIVYSPLGGVTQEQFGTDTAVYNKLFYNSRGQLAEIRESTTPNDTSWNRGALINFYSNQCWGMCAGQSMTDNNGNLKKQEVYVPDNEAISSYVVYTNWFNYDSLNRLQSANGERWASGPNVLSDYWKQTFLPYDRYGNRRIDPNPTQTYGGGINNKDFTVSDVNNRLGVPGGQSGVMSYDNAGNLTNDTYTGAGNRTYDAENRITQAWGGNGQWQYYTYNGDGQRVRRKVNNKETWQVYGIGGELVAEYDANAASSSAPLKEYGYRNGQLLVAAEQVNLALGKSATQSSTNAPPTTDAAKAVDGNTNGALWDGYASATNFNTNAWWQVDLGSVQSIGAIQVWGRSDCCPEMTTNYYVFVSDNPFTSTNLNTTLTQPGVSNYYVPGYSGTPGTVNANRTGRYVRVQLAASQYLVLGEVKVLRNTADVNWLVTDQLGTPRMIFDKTGSFASVKRHDYLPFGEEISAFGGRTTAQGYNVPDGIRQQFTQKERDIETGLDYFLARYYSSTQGRFTSPDEFTGGPDELYYFADDAAANPTFYADLTNPQSFNKYQYTYNNPLNLTDDDGHCPACRILLDYVGRRAERAAENNPAVALDVVQTVVSVVGIAPGAGEVADVANAGISLARGNKGEAALDLAGALGPVGSVAAVGNRIRKIAKVASKADDVVDGASATRRGLASEKRVLNDIGERKNTQKVSSPEGNSVPDYQNKTTVGEIKDTKTVANTRQVRIQRHAAEASGRRHEIQTGRNTRVRSTVRGSTIKRRDDLGPQ